MGRPALILAVLYAVGATGLVGPPPAGGALQAGDTSGGSDTTTVHADSMPKLGAVTQETTRLDSLRDRAARFRAAIMRLRVRHRVRVERVESGLRFELPYPPPVPARDSADEAGGPLVRVADLARRYYPSASIAVLGTVDGAAPRCGTGAERSRARDVAERLQRGGGIDPERIRRVECVRSPGTEAAPPPGARADSVSGATIYIEWDSREDTS